jgi:uncharacterized membrane protein
MPFCSACGAQVDQAAFCPKCGAPQNVTAPMPVSVPGISPAQPVTSGGLSENVAGALCYALGWITGLIFLLIDKRPFVKFHAAQSIVVFGALHIIHFVVAMIFVGSILRGGVNIIFGAGATLLHILDLLIFILWIVLMIKAYQGDRFKVPVAADVAESLAGKQA